jgi:alkanesulfonate monooxygenase SsuD/methylene tetrahydromethanopterin reductase-like flavin-dependent oxidoreductase (luciferase family)
MEEAVKLILAMWREPRTTFKGKYFHVEDAILEPKPVQRPHPPVMIAGGGETMTLRVVARYGDMCNVAGSPEEVRRKFDVLQRHCETEGRDFSTIEKTNITSLLLARTDADLAAKRVRLGIGDAFNGFAGTVAAAQDRIGAYRDAGVDMMIASIARNDIETIELLASEIVPRFDVATPL